MSKTVADHARAYRARRANKLARYEAALREIAEQGSDMAGWAVADLAANALATPTTQS